tara:strand:+ start:117 stop:860 length:744 start_codon:yes stop_codon:yes gene_type:complete
MANGPSFFGENTPDYGLGQDIIRILGLSPEGHVGGGSTYTESVKHSTPQSYTVNTAGASAGKPRTISAAEYNANPSLYAGHYSPNYYADETRTSEDYGMFDPFNEGMIATALAKKYGLSAEEQKNLFTSGMFQPLSRSMTQMLDPQQYRTEFTQGQTADPTVFLTQPSTDSGMAGSGMASKRALQARQALLKQRAEGIAKMSGNILGQKDSILQQITAWDTAAKEAVVAAGVGTEAEDDEPAWKFWK